MLKAMNRGLMPQSSTFNCLGYVNGVEDDTLLTEEEEREIETQFKRLNKPAVKTIQMTHGDLYDCVDFYKQPAFDHPLLKNHTFHPQMRPSSAPKMLRNTKSKNQQTEFARVGCPVGTVPIRRVTKNDLVRAKLHEKKYASNYNMLDIANPGSHFAVLQTKFDINKKYHGGNAYMSVYSVSVLDHNQYSLSQIVFRHGSDLIAVGIMTNPSIYNNEDTHVFILTKTSRGQCFNLLCSGFVHVNKDMAVDPRIDLVSRRGGPIITTKFNVYKANDGNWWFELDEPGMKIGFWPSSIFSAGLQDAATTIEWGGEVFSPVDVPSPPMGSGGLPGDDSRDYAFCEYIKSINEDNVELHVGNFEVFNDIQQYYTVRDEGYVGKDNGHLAFFGGPGGFVGK